MPDEKLTIHPPDAAVRMPLAAHSSTTAQKAPRRAGACMMLIFGAAGDLTKRLLLPAVCNLATQNLLPQEFCLLGIDRVPMSDDEFRDRVRQAVSEGNCNDPDHSGSNWMADRAHYLQADFADPKSWDMLKQLLEELDEKHQTGGNVLFYLAVAPQFFLTVAQQLGRLGVLNQENGHWRRLVIEKPFGHDLESARKLNRDLAELMREDQIYRIDHYLGKETVQNIMAFRFGNGIFEPIWNRRYIDHIQITVAETVGVEKRGGYYEHAGAARDMVPNHILQLVSLTAMEPPISLSADPVHNEQSKVLSAISIYRPEDVLTHAVRGQYGPSEDDGPQLAGYRQEPLVDPESVTETYVALKLMIDNWRWADVPIYVRTGKRMPRRVTEIAIHFRRAPFVLFRQTAVERLAPNILIMHIQPKEGISLRFEAKIPGPLVQLEPVEMSFAYADYFGRHSQTGYETLLYDAMLGDGTLFQRADMIESGWNVIKPVLEVWGAIRPDTFPNYPAGSWGPERADEMLARDGRAWRKIEE
jgi:glucose-6-phosphate 1-dehydrogenase